MCNKCYEQFVYRTEKLMLFCIQKKHESDELSQLCICQRFCSEKDKYIPHHQKSGCKDYE